MSNLKEYSVKELAHILGCSITAVQKKIKPDKNNPEIKRYKQRFNTVIKEGKTYIQLTDEELEQEKILSKGYNNVSYNVSEDVETVINNGYKAETLEDKENLIDKILDFTNGYIQRYETLQKTFYDELKNKDKQIYLLTTSENKKEAEYLEVQAKAKELEEKNKELIELKTERDADFLIAKEKQAELENKNKRLLIYFAVVTGLFITFIILFIIFQIM